MYTSFFTDIIMDIKFGILHTCNLAYMYVFLDFYFTLFVCIFVSIVQCIDLDFRSMRYTKTDTCISIT